MFLAKLLSRLLHPIFIPTITLAIISTKFLNIIILSNQLNIIIIGTVIFTLLFPLLSILYLLFTKRIKSLQIEEKEERILPILFTIIWMLIGYYFLGNILEYAPVVNSIYLGMIATLGIGEKIVVLSIGHPGNFVIEACKKLEKKNVDIGHYNMIFVKPIDVNILKEVCENYSEIITIEDGCLQGGFGSSILEFISDNEYKINVHRLGIPR